MRWIMFIIIAIFLLVLERGLVNLVQIDSIVPSPVFIFAVFLALTAPTSDVPWAALSLGILLDLSQSYLSDGGMRDFVLVGPMALGFLVASTFAMQTRGMVFRDSPFSIALMVFIAGIFMQLVVVSVLTLRGLPFLTNEPLADWHWSDQLVKRFWSLLYSAFLACFLSPILIRLEPLLGIYVKGGQERSRRVV